jgi:hypothetical protein
VAGIGSAAPRAPPDLQQQVSPKQISQNKSSSWMMLVHGLPQARPHHVRINLGGGYVSVPQHRLHASQIGAAFQQMRSEGVPKHVGRQVVENSGFLAITRQQLPESLPRHRSAAIGDE